jgi:hypothetical protein
MLQAGRSQVRFPMRAHNFSIDLLFLTTLLTHHVTEMSSRNLLGVKGGRSARKAHNLAAVCDPIV